jgi:hypothetical protein
MPSYTSWQELLKSQGRDPAAGWTVTGQHQEIKPKTVNDRGVSVTQDTPTGNIIWTIAGPNGQTDEVVVAPTTDPTSANKGGAAYDIVTPPKKSIPKATAAPQPKTVTTKSGGTYVIQPGDNGGYNAVPVGGLPKSPDEAVTANTTDPYIISRDPTTGNLNSVPNPNYNRDPKAVTANTTDPFIVTRDPVSGDLKQEPNPNYHKAGPTSVSTNTTDKYIVARDADGNLVTQENPNYHAPTPTSVATNTTDKFIVARDQDGNLVTKENPNYQKPAPTTVSGTNTTDKFIVSRDPISGATSTVPNPNYVAPKPTALTGDTNTPYLLSQDNEGNVTQVANPNYDANKQTPTSTSSTQPYVVSTDRSGKVTQQANPNYQPTDPALRIGQLTGQANQQRDILNQQVQQGSITADQAAKQFDQWWGQNIAPQQQEIQLAQQTQALDYQVKQQQELRNQFTTAQQAGKDAAANAQALLPYQVGPGFGAAIGKLASGGDLSGEDFQNAVMFKTPDLNAISAQGAAEALKHISPAAAQAAGAPMPNYQDITAGLNQANFGFGAGAGGGAAGGGPQFQPGQVQAGSPYQATPSTAAPVAPVMPGVPAPGAPTGPNLNPGQPQMGSPIGLTTTPTNTPEPGGWSTPMTFTPQGMQAAGGPTPQLNLMDPITGLPRQVANTAPGAGGAAPLPTPFASPGSQMMNSFNQAIGAGAPAAGAPASSGLIPGTTSVPWGPAGYPPGQYPFAGYPYQLPAA